MSAIGPETVLLVFLLFCRIGGCLMLMPGFSSARVRCSSSSCIKRPAAEGNRDAMAAVEAWARWAQENASST